MIGAFIIGVICGALATIAWCAIVAGADEGDEDSP